MAEGKKSFVLYADLLETAEALPEKLQAALFLQILRYVNDQNPEDPKDQLLKIAFIPIKQSLKRDLKKWENKSVKNTESGRLGGIKSGKARSERSERLKREANEPVNVNVNVSVNDNDNDNEIKKDYPFSENFIKVWFRWLSYKKDEHKFKYKKWESEIAGIKNLFELANGNEEIAEKIINQSIGNSWKGFFSLKENTVNNKTSFQKKIEHINYLTGTDQ